MCDTIVSFNNKTCHIELFYPKALKNISLVNLKKLFALMFDESWRNAGAIQQTESTIQNCVADAKGDWYKASKGYTDGYKSDSFDPFMTDKQKRLVQRENKRLLAEVKRAKKAYERFVKIQKTFEQIKNKYQ